MTQQLSDELTFEFSELFQLKQLALKLNDTVAYYKNGMEKNENAVRQLLREKMEMQLELESIQSRKSSQHLIGGGRGGVGVQSSSITVDAEKVALSKSVSILGEQSVGFCQFSFDFTLSNCLGTKTTNN